ncbi:MAG: sulfatase, partial [Acidobacteriia bacterium 12-62-4]
MLGGGFGAVGLAGTLEQKTHFPAKAKHVIFLFLNGGVSQVDTFDPKPELTRQHGKPLPGKKLPTDSATGNLMKSPFSFQPCGQSGIEVADIFPRVGAMIDDFAVIRSCYADNGNHGPSLMLMNTGHQLAGRPSMGSWISYGLGTLNKNLPGFIALCPGYPVMGPRLWSSGFLPNLHQGTYVPNNERTPEKLVQNIRNASLTIDEQQ